MQIDNRVVEFNSYFEFRIKEISNLTEKNELIIFHNVLTAVILFSNDINSIKDTFLEKIQCEIPYVLCDIDRLDYLIKEYIY